MTRNATKRPPPHDRARALEQTLRVLPGAAGARGELETGEAAPRPGLAGPMTLEKPTAMVSSECSQHGELGRELTKRITAGHVTTESTIQRGQGAKSAL